MFNIAFSSILYIISIGGVYMELNIEYLKKRFGEKASEYANDKKKSAKLINDALIKSRQVDVKNRLGEMFEGLKLVISLFKDWLNGSYKDIPIGSIILIIIGLIYFVSPIDLIPDFLPPGYIDDALVLGMIINQIEQDLKKYKTWKSSQQ
jgi:uncharacterized membrane protein YkvA (DUF1232 family)